MQLATYSRQSEGIKERGQGRSSRDGRGIHIRWFIMGAGLGTVYGRVSFSSQATREMHLIRSQSRHALLLPAVSPRSQDPPRPRFSVFHPVADKTSFLFPLLEFLGILRQIPFANSNLFPPSASFHPSSPSRLPPLVPSRQI